MSGADGFGVEPGTEEWLFYLLFQAVRRRDAAFAPALAALGLDHGKWRALSVVRRQVGCTMNELAELTTIDRTTLTRITDQLAEAGLVQRQGSPADRRRVCLAVTAAGEAVFADAMAAMRSFNLNALAGVEEVELAMLKRALAKILYNLTASEPQLRAILEFARH